MPGRRWRNGLGTRDSWWPPVAVGGVGVPGDPDVLAGCDREGGELERGVALPEDETSWPVQAIASMPVTQRATSRAPLRYAVRAMGRPRSSIWVFQVEAGCEAT